MAFKLVIVSPEKNLYDDEVKSVVLTGTNGSFGIQANHADMVAALGSGPVKITDIDGAATTPFLIDAGFVKVEKEQVLVLSDQAFTPEEIDADAEQAKLSELLKQRPDGDDAYQALAAAQAACRAKIKFKNG